MSSIINYDETVSTLVKPMTVIDVVAQKSVIDVINQANKYLTYTAIHATKRAWKKLMHEN
jgi:hypothetical protein